MKNVRTAHFSGWFLIIGILLGTWGLPTTYYLSPSGEDGNDGSLTRSFRSMEKAFSVVAEGDTVVFRAGSYTPKTEILLQISRLTLKAFENEIPIIDGQFAVPDTKVFLAEYKGPTATNDGVVYQAGQVFTNYRSSLLVIRGSNVVVDGLYFQRSKGNGLNVALGGNNVLIKNCKMFSNLQIGLKIEEVNGFQIEDSQMWENASFARFSRQAFELNWPLAGIMIKASSNGVVSRCVLYHNWGEALGIWMSRDCVVEDSHVWDNYAVEIYLDNAHTTTIQRNLVYHTGDPLFFRNNAPCRGIAIANELYSFYKGAPGAGRTIINNLLYGNKVHIGFSIKKGDTTPGGCLSNELIANNTLVDSPLTSKSMEFQTGENPHFNTRIANNLVYNLQKDSISVGSHLGLIFDHNLYSQEVASEVFGKNDVLGDPLLLGGSFTKSESFQLTKTSPALNKGVFIKWVNTDFLKQLRKNPFTIGAFDSAD